MLNKQHYLYKLLTLLNDGQIDVAEFCFEFERAWNFDIDKKELSEYESQIYNAIFDKIVWYSPFPEEREEIPNYIGEKEVRDVAKNALINTK